MRVAKDIRSGPAEGVVTDLVDEQLNVAATTALAHADAWDSFTYYVRTVCELQVSHPAVADVIEGALPSADRLMKLCAQTVETSKQVVTRAQDAGVLRADVTAEDLLALFAASAAIARSAESARPLPWRRHVEFVPDGFRSR